MLRSVFVAAVTPKLRFVGPKAKRTSSFRRSVPASLFSNVTQSLRRSDHTSRSATSWRRCPPVEQTSRRSARSFGAAAMERIVAADLRIVHREPRRRQSAPEKWSVYGTFDRGGRWYAPMRVGSGVQKPAGGPLPGGRWWWVAGGVFAVVAVLSASGHVPGTASESSSAVNTAGAFHGDDIMGTRGRTSSRESPEATFSSPSVGAIASTAGTGTT